MRRAESEPCAACSTASAAAAAALPAPLRAERGVVVLPPPVGARRGEERRGEERRGEERRGVVVVVVVGCFYLFYFICAVVELVLLLNK